MSLAEELGFDFKSEPCERFSDSGYRYPCRKCIPCLIRRQRAWVSRLTEELREHPYNYFITLTYAPEHLPSTEDGVVSVFKPHLIKLNRDLRKRFQQGKFTFHYETREGLPMEESFDLPDIHYKYYLTSEYGPAGHLPHYHGVFYNMPEDRYLVECLFKECWPYGFVSVFPAMEGAAGYVSKYLVTDGVGKESYTDPYSVSPFALMSKGIGLSYVRRMLDYHQADWQNRCFTQYRGVKGSMDRYLKHKVFTEDQLQYFAEQFYDNMHVMSNRYYLLKLREPLKYEQIMKDRTKYFEDLRYSIEQKVLKKHSLK